MKKIVLILGFIVFTSFGASAQYANLKIENGELTFMANGTQPFNIRKIGSMGGWIGIGTDNGMVSFVHTFSEAYADIYVRDVYQNSDARVKTDIRPVSSATNTLLKLKPVTYRFTNSTKSKSSQVAGADGRDTGFLAQEVAQVLPNSVMTDGNGNMFINYSSIIPLLVKTVQEQNVRIDALEKRIANLENK